VPEGLVAGYHKNGAVVHLIFVLHGRRVTAIEVIRVFFRTAVKKIIGVVSVAQILMVEAEKVEAVIYAKPIRKVNVTVVLPVAFCTSKIEALNGLEVEDYLIQTRWECAPVENRDDFLTSKKLKAVRDNQRRCAILFKEATVDTVIIVDIRTRGSHTRRSELAIRNMI